MREYFKNSLGPGSRCALGGAGAGSAQKNKGSGPGVAYLHRVGTWVGIVGSSFPISTCSLGTNKPGLKAGLIIPSETWSRFCLIALNSTDCMSKQSTSFFQMLYSLLSSSSVSGSSPCLFTACGIVRSVCRILAGCINLVHGELRMEENS